MLLDALAGNVDTGAFLALVAVLGTAIWRGWLVPRPTVEKLEEAFDKIAAVQEMRLAESTTRESEWKAAWVAENAKGQVLAGQIADLVEYAKTADHVLRSLPGQSRRRGDGG